MGKITDQRLALLDDQIELAAITELDNDPGFFQVFVPGAVREDNKVKASSAEDAKKKVHQLLKQKTKDYAEVSTGHVVIQPRSLK